MAIRKLYPLLEVSPLEISENNRRIIYMTFDSLKIDMPLLKALKDKGYEQPTPIQQQAIPQILNKKDILGCAQTGTGKTAAFCIPIIQRINRIEGNRQGKPMIRSLILTPTRELAIQISDNLKAYAKHTGIKHAVIYGGVKQSRQVEQLNRGVHILVATPGRLMDLVHQGFIHLNTIKIFVLDEADRMLDMGFINDINKIIQLLPKQRQSLFFSATMPTAIVKLAHNILFHPVKVMVSPQSTTADTVKQYLYFTNKNLKEKLLLHILDEWKVDQVLVFTRTKHGADRLTRNLKKKRLSVAAIHGDKAQNQRQKALNQFKAGKIKILIATNIAARGIDINQLEHVINYDIPVEAESYVHRIGRSGRAGKDGISISLCEPEEIVYVKAIQKLIKQKIEVVADHPFPQTEKPMSDAERREWNKEKQKRRQEFFANRKKKRSTGQDQSKEGQSAGRSSNNNRRKKKKKNTFSRNQSKEGQQPEHSGGKNSGQKRKKKSRPNNQKRKGPNTLSSKMKWPLEK